MRGQLLCDVDSPVVRLCMEVCLQNINDLEDDILTCNICSVINSMLKHFANCNKSPKECSICIQIFTLICSHIYYCTNTYITEQLFNDDRSVCEIQLCGKVKLMLGGASITSQLALMWFKIRKALARIIDGVVEEFDDIGPVDPTTGFPPVAPIPSTTGTNAVSHTPLGPTKSAPGGRSMKGGSRLPSIPEGQASPNASRVLVRKVSDLTKVEETQARSKDSTGVPDPPDQQSASPVTLPRPEQTENSIEDPKSRSDDEESEPESGRFGKKYRYTSLPMGPPGSNSTYLPSLKEKPTGIRGIGKLWTRLINKM